MTQITKIDDDLKPYVEPELPEFEHLSPTIDTQSHQINNINTNSNINHVTNDIDIDVKTHEEKCSNKEEERSVNLMQHQMEMLNNQIEKNLDYREKLVLLDELFRDCPPGTYLITNWILKHIKNSFNFGDGGSPSFYQNSINKYVNSTSGNKKIFSSLNEMNLKCVNVILDHGSELHNTLQRIILKKRGKNNEENTGILEQYFARYNHKCKTSDYFIVNDNNNISNQSNEFMIIDILRNILIQTAIVYRVFKMVQHTQDNNPIYEFGFKKKVGKEYWILFSIERYLRLDLLDLSIPINGVTLYHLLVYQQRINFLALLLHTVPCDWSMLKDNSNQV